MYATGEHSLGEGVLGDVYISDVPKKIKATLAISDGRLCTLRKTTPMTKGRVLPFEDFATA